jgi:hypothetical protein
VKRRPFTLNHMTFGIGYGSPGRISWSLAGWACGAAETYAVVVQEKYVGEEVLQLVANSRYVDRLEYATSACTWIDCVVR